MLININLYRKRIAAFLLLLIASEIISPLSAYALTGGPSQPEVQSFEPANTNQMVDLFTGDAMYNLPLMDVGGYPVNLSYHTEGVTADAEASWVGLGWNLSPGYISRGMRGLPDDFNGDLVVKELNINKNWTVGADIGLDYEVVGFPLSVGYNTGVYYNNNNGIGFRSALSVGMTAGVSASFMGGALTAGLSASAGLSVSMDSQEGIGVSPSLGLGAGVNVKSKNGVGGASGEIGLGFSANSRQGYKALTISSGIGGSFSNSKLSTGLGFSTTSVISYASVSMFPSSGFPMDNFSFSGSLKLGVESTWQNLGFSLDGYYTRQKLYTRKQELAGYGYMYFDRANRSRSALLDFNREKDLPFHVPNKKSGDDKGSPVLAIPNYQYDLYSVSGQGIGGQYRSKRGDAGAVYDVYVEDVAGSASVGVDLDLGNLAAVGFNVNVINSNTVTSSWSTGNNLYDFLQFSGNDNSLYEPVAFTNVGEKTINDQSYYDAFGDVDPIRAKVSGAAMFKQVDRKFEQFRDYNKIGEITPTLNKKTNREKRNQVFSFLTAGEATAALDRYILDYPNNFYPIGSCNRDYGDTLKKIDRLVHSNYRKDHISEISVINSDGKRYVYGIPAYNRYQREAVFNIDAPSDINAAIATGSASYNPGGSNPDNSIENVKGKDHFFAADNIPDYAHSYLLTAVLSPDYVDLTGDGVSDDDLGDAVRFNYSRVYGTDEKHGLYQWRVPYRSNQGNYQQGLKVNPRDDKASYLYGKKEMWILNSIESKTMVAVFRCSSRNDGLGVASENGGQNVNALSGKLDQIDLYSKSDVQVNGIENAVPIKSVHFEYSYGLCTGVDNSLNGGGKLTLTKVWFTYMDNNKGKLNPYVFTYNVFNPPYHIKKYDRWGNYQNNYDNSLIGRNASGYGIAETEFPYTIQDTITANKNAAAWALKSITLPTGGTINIDLEADRYAYVQNKPAMQMYQIFGIGEDTLAVSHNLLYHKQALETEHYRYLYIRVNDVIPSTNSKSYIKQHYIGDSTTNMFFNVAVKMYSNHSPNQAEYVFGYCDIEDYGLCVNRPNTVWLRLKAESVNNSGEAVANPIAKSAWQFLRLNLPELAYQGSSSLSDDGTTSFIEVVKALVGAFADIQNILIGFNGACIERKWCQEVVLARSWVRLCNGNYDKPGGGKLGGGSRVKQVTISDNWEAMVHSGDPTAETSVYGQMYDYTMFDEETKQTISSGVAAYEPMTGNSENPFRLPLKYQQNTRMAPHNEFFIETPVCESFFPAPNVGYRQVTVRSYGSAQVPADKRTGYTVHKFYTAFDFPTRTEYTPGGADAFSYATTPPSFNPFYSASMNKFNGTQGFMVELNDMHGKTRAEEVYDNNGSLISGTEYFYKSEMVSDQEARLDNQALVLMPNGKQNMATIGKEVEVMFDTREQKSNTYSIGGGAQLDFSFIIPLPSINLSFSHEQVQFNSIAATKVVRRYGLLDKVVASQYGSSVTTQNLVWDAETGDVLLTRTENEFNDPVYNFSLPAHFAYEGMESAYKNVDAVFKGVTISSGKIIAPAGIEQYFTAGDEVLISDMVHISWNSASKKVWVIDPHSMNASAAHKIILVDGNGQPISKSNVQIKITRSGHRNMQSLPVATITSLESPIVADSLNPTVNTKILNTAVTEYSEQWKVNCEKLPKPVMDDCSAIPSCDCIGDVLGWLKDNHKVAIPYSEKINTDTFSLGGCMTVCSKNPSYHSIYALTPDSMLRSNRPYQIVLGSCILTLSMAAPAPLMNYKSGSIYTMNVDWLSSSDSCESLRSGNEVYGFHILDSATNTPIQLKGSLYCNPQYHYACADLDSNGAINPYRYGILGNWRPYKQWTYRGFRSPSTIGTTDIRHDGIYQSYSNFWTYNHGEQKYVRNVSSSGYITATTSTKYNSQGAEIENKDAAGIYSSALYGYLQTQPVAVAKNARYKQIGFDGFEDYDFVTDCSNPCRTDNFSYSNVLQDTVAVVDTIAHTGNRSLTIFSEEALTMIRDLKIDSDAPVIAFDSTDTLYRLTASGCLPKFSPDTGRYFFSAWVKEEQPCTAAAYTNNQVNISFSGAADSYTFTPSGIIIDGWQRIEGVFFVPASAIQIKIQLQSLNGKVYFDDVRAQPFNSSMKTYVYHWKNLRLMAELDENNYATFYEYNDLGELIRIKKETERGIMTVQETRSTLKKL